MDYRFGKDAFGRQEGEGRVSEGEAKLGRGEQREGSCAGSGRVLEGLRLGGGKLRVNTGQGGARHWQEYCGRVQGIGILRGG